MMCRCASLHVVIFVTSGNTEEAEKIAKFLVENKLAACVNIVPGVKSFFWWGNSVDVSTEVLLIIKSKAELFEKLCTAIKSIHGYAIPEIIALPIVDGYHPYLDWIEESLRSG